MSERAQHHFEFVNDDFRVTIDATCDDWTWSSIVTDVGNRLTQPTAIITFPEKLSASEAERMTATKDRYTAHIAPAAIGWTAAISWHAPNGTISIEGPTFWRPTERWANHSATSHMRRQMRKHARRSSGYEIGP